MFKFVVGDRVFDNQTQLTGEVTNGFYWRDSSGNPPRADQIPVQWDDGTESYINPGFLQYEQV